MGRMEDRLAERGLTLPPEAAAPPGVTLPFEWVRVSGNRAVTSGHGPLTGDGALASPFGKVPSEVSVEDAQAAACAATLALLSSLKRALGDLDRVAAWLLVTGFVNADSSFPSTTLVINPASELILDLFGQEVGAHARTAMGYATVPFNLPVLVAAEVEVA